MATATPLLPRDPAPRPRSRAAWAALFLAAALATPPWLLVLCRLISRFDPTAFDGGLWPLAAIFLSAPPVAALAAATAVLGLTALRDRREAGRSRLGGALLALAGAALLIPSLAISAMLAGAVLG